MRKNRSPFHLEHWHKIALCLVIYDVIAVNVSYFLALLIRFDFKYSMIDASYLDAFIKFIPINTVMCLVVFNFLHMYRSMWRFASYSEFARVVASSAVTFILHTALITLFFNRMPLSYYIWGALMQFFLVLSVRFAYRFYLLAYGDNQTKKNCNVMLIGAGQAGQIILRDIRSSRTSNDRVVCIIDDNKNKHGRYIDGVIIAGDRYSIPENVEKYKIDKIYFAIPSATVEQRRDIINIASKTNCELKQLPGVEQLFSGKVTVSQMKEVSIEDLLGREPVKAEISEVFEILCNKTVLVTGAGGSIGSELCRQIITHNPKRLIILDIYENSLYEIQLEIKEKYPDSDLVTEIASVRDSRKMFEVFETYHPQIVYHAAAHKHVPLMEENPCESIKNNAIGTYKTAYAAMVNGCERFVLISTDKAVNPTNIMGASKRICEMIIQSFDSKVKAGKANEIPQLFTHEETDKFVRDKYADALKNTKTEFVAVRFGNVLGSNGSVLHIFKKQIEKGGPVTVTHPDIIRYFMTIPEAVSLVLLAGAYAKGGEIFVLDMGSPMHIADLARNMIKLSGYVPDKDIKIEYTGLRPGEKLYEEKLMAEEGLRTTANKMIYIGKPIAFDEDEFFVQLETLMQEAYENNSRIKEMVAAIVPTYKVQQ